MADILDTSLFLLNYRRLSVFFCPDNYLCLVWHLLVPHGFLFSRLYTRLPAVHSWTGRRRKLSAIREETRHLCLFLTKVVSYLFFLLDFFTRTQCKITNFVLSISTTVSHRAAKRLVHWQHQTHHQQRQSFWSFWRLVHYIKYIYFAVFTDRTIWLLKDGLGGGGGGKADAKRRKNLEGGGSEAIFLKEYQ